MQKIIILLLSLSSVLACGQDTDNEKNAEDHENFNSKYVRLIKDTTTMMLIENVKITYGDIYVEADSALYEKSKKAITAYGIKHLKFKGEVISKENYANVIRYTLGEGKFNN